MSVGLPVVWPSLKERFFADHTQPSQRIALLELVNSIVQGTAPLLAAPANANATDRDRDRDGVVGVRMASHPLAPLVDDLIDLLCSALIGGV